MREVVNTTLTHVEYPCYPRIRNTSTHMRVCAVTDDYAHTRICNIYFLKKKEKSMNFKVSSNAVDVVRGIRNTVKQLQFALAMALAKTAM